ncbi:alpha/beta fold hydrolase [Streptomyces sp. NBC_01361]|uniref:alpha/beta fold hydrolase n=1 Tax=Streptomyces sp. NBC_01361 TaxID=2903838 RepID=UPI002E342570|nr:alpha/beta hydrolase [Streptomyces sp. NBC_01361]
MREIELSAGTIEYEDTGGQTDADASGPTVVFLHGLMMDASLWDGPIAELSGEHRCVAPTLPLGAHRRAMRDDADLSLPGVARLVVEFLDRLDLRDVTLVGNDTGGALVQLVISEGAAERVGRVVLVSCEAFDNLPPGLTGRTLALAGKLSPRMFGLFMQQMRLGAVRRLPVAFGWLTKRGGAATGRWTRPVITQPEIRRDAVRMLRAVFADTRVLLRAAERLPAFDRPALVVWAHDDRVMPVDHGRRLAELLPHGRLVEIEDSYTLIPLDRPTELAVAVREFTRAPDPDPR